jgi:hypothetical protein
LQEKFVILNAKTTDICNASYDDSAPSPLKVSLAPSLPSHNVVHRKSTNTIALMSTTTAFTQDWVEELEREFDRAYIDLDRMLTDLDPEQV